MNECVLCVWRVGSIYVSLAYMCRGYQQLLYFNITAFLLMITHTFTHTCTTHTQHAQHTTHTHTQYNTIYSQNTLTQSFSMCRKENTLPHSVEFQFLFKLLSFLGHFDVANVARGDGTGDEEQGINKEAVKKLFRVMMTSEEGGVCCGSGLNAVLCCLQVAQEYEVYQVRVEGGYQVVVCIMRG